MPEKEDKEESETLMTANALCLEHDQRLFFFQAWINNLWFINTNQPTNHILNIFKEKEKEMRKQREPADS